MRREITRRNGGDQNTFLLSENGDHKGMRKFFIWLVAAVAGQSRCSVTSTAGLGKGFLHESLSNLVGFVEER